jgi:acetyl-CoA/propionyl-CoA carboxylase, biotin carboxylase, biotin carboxyl carrier protein
MFDTVLVANRGEIAVRIMRTLRSLGIRSVAVFSDADRDARHVDAADAAVHIGPPAASQSYLDVGRVIDAAVRSGAQALHPGYGFLSENVALAEACADAGIVFIGPPVAAIETMGDKIRAKATVAGRGVRVVPGVSGVGLDDDALIEAATAVGLPLLIKPSAGGGGKGMRLVTAWDDLPAEIGSAKREARTSFGDDTLLIERYIERPRHIEVQVLADGHGNIVHVGERECSLQRRHQKVIEEAPSPYLSDEQRAVLGGQAIEAARACGYVNAGTVEFIVSGEHADDAFFLEMNTRLQVEHPVTELVWGIDLVEQQLRIAAGEALPFVQADLRPRGHAFEARVYAEDPARGFLPTGGTVALLREPDDHAHVRVDSSLRAGTRVGSDYDPMLSKIIAWGVDRDAARRRLDRALADTVVLGVTTNVAFLRTLLVDPAVAAGTMDTGLVERIADDAPSPTTPPAAAIAAALATLDAAGHQGAWGDRSGWRVGERAWIRWQARDVDGGEVHVRVRASAAAWEATIGEQTWRVGFSRRGEDVRIELDGVVSTLAVAVVGDDVWVAGDGATWQLSVASTRGGTGTAIIGAFTLASPMPGTVVAVNVAVGETIPAGHPVVVVEAMKMEHTLRAPQACIVSEVAVHAGDRVDLRQTLVVLAPAADRQEPA